MIYETSFLFLPTLASDELAVQVGKLKEIITSNGGEIVSEEYPQLISLSYPIRHRLENKYTVVETAYFGWAKYELDPEKAGTVKKLLDEIKVLVRYLTLKTVKENTMVSKDVFAILQGKDIVATPVQKPAQKTSEEEGEMDKEEVDGELDKMLEDDSTEEKIEEVEVEKE